MLLPPHWSPSSAQHYSCNPPPQEGREPSLHSLGNSRSSLQKGGSTPSFSPQSQMLQAKKHTIKGTDLLRCS